MNSDYKIVFIDIDGTLVDDKKIIGQETIDLLKRLDASGVPIIITSGRLPKGVEPYRKALGLERPIITYGGGLVLNSDGTELLNQGMNREQAERLYQYLSDQEATPALNVFTNTKWFTNKPEHPLEQYEIQMLGLEPDEGSFNELVPLGEKVSKCTVAGFETEIDEILPRLIEAFPDLKILKSQFFLIEVMSPDTSKAEGIKKVLEFYNFQSEEAIGIGDSYNDLEMLDFVGLPVVMKNAPEDLKNNPNYTVTKDDNNNNGVAHFLEGIFYL